MLRTVRISTLNIDLDPGASIVQRIAFVREVLVDLGVADPAVLRE